MKWDSHQRTGRENGISVAVSGDEGGGEGVQLCKRSFVRRLSSLARRKIKVEERNLHSLNRCCSKVTLSPTRVAADQLADVSVLNGSLQISV